MWTPRRALHARDKCCQFPGCAHTRYLQGHHLVHWVDGDQTRIDDLVLLCSRHHRLHHEGGYSIHKHSAGLVFRNADGKVIPEAPPYRSIIDLDASRDARQHLLNTSRDACRDDQEHPSWLTNKIQEPGVVYLH